MRRWNACVYESCPEFQQLEEPRLFWIDTTILVGSILLLLGVVLSKFSAQFGMPVLVTFLGLGMLAGSDGIGGIEFEDYSLAYATGTIVLAFILFSGGLGTPISAVRDTWRPAGLLATVGVFLTAVFTGLAASWILDIPLAHGMLLGSIVGSTDASAVFSIFRTGGIFIRRTLADTLEVESGSNDPMAIFMTIGMLQYLTGKVTSGLSLLTLLCNQMLVGLLIGVLTGYAAVWSIRKIRLEVAGLYPILATAFGLLSYGLAADLGGSGFLSVYLTGMVIGNNRVPFQRGIEAFHDATAWLGQMVMFILLGLLSFPSRLGPVVLPGLEIAAVLIVVSRPLAVSICLMRSRFLTREKIFLSLIGLKGAVPITLAIFPLMANIEGAHTIFDVVFFVVLVSAVLQGTSLKWIAQLLKLNVPPKRVPPIILEISSLEDVYADIVDYYIDVDTCAAGKAIRELALPDEVVVALVVRQNQIRLPKGSFKIEPGDHVVVVLHRDVRSSVDQIFSRTRVENTEKIAELEPTVTITCAESTSVPPPSQTDQRATESKPSQALVPPEPTATPEPPATPQSQPAQPKEAHPIPPEASRRKEDPL
jgi:potassium/hydrogen antiporter